MNDSTDLRIHTSQAQLMALKSYAAKLNYHPALKHTSLMAGRTASAFRGRGLNFEELRHYHIGDDVRNIDWKVTMRTGKPHVRSYTEEKDRNVIIVVDQRSGMFFGSLELMKSVVAAELAALYGWKVLNHGDRVRLIMLTPDTLWIGQPQRQQSGYAQQLAQLVAHNQALNVESRDKPEVSFTHMVSQLERMKIRQSTIVIISDWHDCDENQLDQLKQMQRRNDVIAIRVVDPMEQTIPQSMAQTPWVVGDGQFQTNLDMSSKIDKVNQRLEQWQSQSTAILNNLMAIKRLPYLEVNTLGNHISDFTAQFGGR
ncbi:DUF58 domain-containing protein [Vibrio sp. SCSIO 43136]|uniref:DUF58 domain-containing protein n=1 Tax=Vibrio sp. SCSIO 43136 TaxID=2819101 RepID=UPI00207631D1|nr:DUF58 domain-containing protein [Vibrio sp. SCSIO 43136]USD64273.1 DUF58 domain-containing protein [Vibrio sp. SCSIO 43136]